jgi:hypothetical protein
MAKTAFTGVLNNLARDRHFGGTSPYIVADPYITGYHYIKWLKLPDKLQEFVKKGDGMNMDGVDGQDGIKNFLESSCLSVTPPGGTLNKTEFTGIGGLKWSVPTNMDYTNTLTIKFLEFTHLPILNIFHGWVRMIRDYKTGTSHLNDGDSAYTKSAYAGTLLYWTTKPDGRTVEYSAAYTGIFPTKDPQDLFTSDVTAVDKLEIDMEFNVDWTWHEKWVHDKAQTEAENVWNRSKPEGGYRGSDTAGDGTDKSASA